MPRIAVVLAGCGRADGSEVHESVSTLIHLNRVGAAYRCFAPNIPQADVVNHATGKPVNESRNCLVEAARLSRGEITPLGELQPKDFDAVIFPGGFGAAKNLCTFAKDGENCTVNADVARVITGFHAAKKPIGLICIAPVLAAKLLGTKAGGPGCTVTIGTDEKTAAAIEKMGSKNAPRGVQEAVVDPVNRLVTTPAYMCDAGPYEVFTGIGALIDSLLPLFANGSAVRAN